MKVGVHDAKFNKAVTEEQMLHDDTLVKNLE
jgi:hypothetical protein